MKFLVQSIRSIESMMGVEQKIVQMNEKKNINSMRRSIYAAKILNKNSKINLKNIRIVRPFVSLGPSDIKKVIGKKVKKDININTLIDINSLKK